MKYSAKIVRDRLNACINDLTKISWLFVKNPGKDFTRRRKLPFDQMIKSIVCMSGGSLTNELLDYFKLDPQTPTKNEDVIQG